MWETDSEQVLWRKDEKHFEKRVRRPETVEEEAVEMNSRWGMEKIVKVFYFVVVLWSFYMETIDLCCILRPNGVERIQRLFKSGLFTGSLE
jgi:hypothetical protein